MRKQRTSLDRAYLEKQAYLYEKSQSADRKHDLLYRMGTNADLLSNEEIIAISCNSGRLTKDQRQRVIDLIAKKLNIELDNWDDSPPKIFCLTPDGIKALYYNSDLEDDNLQPVSESSLDGISPPKLQSDVVCLGWDSFNQERDYVKVLVAAGIAHSQAVEVAPLLGKYPRSLEETELITQLWKQLCNFNLQ